MQRGMVVLALGRLRLQRLCSRPTQERPEVDPRVRRCPGGGAVTAERYPLWCYDRGEYVDQEHRYTGPGLCAGLLHVAEKTIKEMLVRHLEVEVQ